MEERTSTADLVCKLGGKFLPFDAVIASLVSEIDARQLSSEALSRLRESLAEDPSTEKRYQIEYQHRVYGSYKPGVDDDDLSAIIGYPIQYATVVEIGGGPSNIARRSQRGICVDLVWHPELSDCRVQFLQADICDSETPVRAKELLFEESLDVKGVVVASMPSRALRNPVLIGLLLFGVLAIGLWPRDKGPKAPDGENGVNPGDTGGGKSDGSTRTCPGHAFGRPHHAGAHSNGRRSASVVPPPHSHRAPNTSASGPDHTRIPAP